ncbi:hypothetical protein [Nakamurella sp. PAMC28650]|uniref:hypothetical protein n=1 Tax=Nakamurella sp. PAMC28650 TaxID=2762325 RepID=UPI00164DB990|nr:hypothetical protein [Nakamurella sp. PAMC28650]QNK81802.1 hypothetical protein H7F38_03080 [Nakamurella sp. PAMC28650]
MGRSGRSGRLALRPGALVGLLLVGLLLVSGCVAPQPVSSGVAPSSASASATVTVTVTRTSVVPAKRTDITAAIAQVRDYVTGAVWNHGQVPGATAALAVDSEAGNLTGRLAYSESVDGASYSRTQSVVATGIGDPATFEMTTRSGSTDPGTLVDVLHRSGNPRHDYLLTGGALRSVAPTAWVTVPARFGNGLGCVVPGRQVLCQVTADLLANQALDPSLPTNTSTTSAGTDAISSAITLRQLLALDVWRLRTAGASLAGRIPAADLDRTLMPVTLSYDALPGSTQGRPGMLTVSGAVVVGGVRISVDLRWDETATIGGEEIHLPVPTKAVYTVLDAVQARRLAALAGRSE